MMQFVRSIEKIIIYLDQSRHGNPEIFKILGICTTGAQQETGLENQFAQMFAGATARVATNGVPTC